MFTIRTYHILITSIFFIFLFISPDLAPAQTCTDADGDGFSIEGGACGQVDCDDTDNTVYPFAPKLCDAKDNNCDGKKDFTTDEDKDGDGVAWCANDCDDNNANQSPLLVEAPMGSTICGDTIDNDCDNRVDNSDPGCQVACKDFDEDGYGEFADASCDFPGEIDCDDTDDTVNPGAIDDSCNGIDNNCDTAIDEAYQTDSSCGVGECKTNNIPSSCVNGVETLCQPGSPVFEGPQNDPTCIGGKDEDCDTFIDGLDPGCNTLCIDQDGDGYGVSGLGDCGIPNLLDCDDTDPAINPGGDDVNCNGIDEDCVGGPDSGYIIDDTCGTGLCNLNNSPSSCIGGVETACQPALPVTEGPTGTATCMDNLDNDCDGLTDTADLANCSSLDVDDDGDGLTENDGDCNDGDPNIYPGAPKICDGKDNNCDNRLDFSTDKDDDGDGATVCPHWQTGLSDCNDNNPNEYPGNSEGPFGDPTCSDGLDNDCSGQADAFDSNCAAPSCVTKSNPKDGPHFDTLLDPGADLLDPSDDTVHPDNSALLCGKCHGPTLADPIRSQCDRCHSQTGSFKQQYPLDRPYGYGSAQNVNIHGSDIVGTQYGTWNTDCMTCHNPHLQEQDNTFGTSYGKLIKEYICFDNPVTGLNIEEVVEFTAMSGTGSFADGPPYTENICNMCHTQTNHHQRDGTAPGGQDHNNGSTCTSCHPHLDGFAPTGGVPPFPHDSQPFIDNCDYCHVTATDFSSPIPDAKCNQCHTAAGVLKDQFPQDFSTAPDVLTHSGKTCVECHNPMFDQGNLMFIRQTIASSVFGGVIEFTAFSGPGSFADGSPFENNICDTCHSLTNHHQADGSAPGGQSHNDGTDCTGCHPHLDGFLPTGGEAQPPHNTLFFNSNCQLCHIETAQGIDFKAIIPDSYCQQCHGARDSHTSDPARNQYASGNYTYDIMCVDCHDPMFPVGNNNRKLLRSSNAFSFIAGSNIINTKRTGPGSLADGPPHEENICETCHSQTLHNRYDGAGIHLDGIDKTGTYCMLCHDHNRAFMVPGPTAAEN